MTWMCNDTYACHVAQFTAETSHLERWQGDLILMRLEDGTFQWNFLIRGSEVHRYKVLFGLTLPCFEPSTWAFIFCLEEGIYGVYIFLTCVYHVCMCVCFTTSYEVVSCLCIHVCSWAFTCMKLYMHVWIWCQRGVLLFLSVCCLCALMCNSLKADEWDELLLPSAHSCLGLSGKCKKFQEIQKKQKQKKKHSWRNGE